MKKRLCALFLTLSLMLGLLVTPVAADTGKFTDDTGSGSWSWASTYIYVCQEAGIITGFTDGSFQPDASLTRAQAATIIALALELTEGESAVSFSDVAEGKWYTSYITLCASNNIISGYENGTFQPEKSVTRAEFATMVARALSLTSTGNACFKDDDGTGNWAWASTYIYACYENGIISGFTDGTFLPASTITRAQAARMIAVAAGYAEPTTATQGQLNALEDAQNLLEEYNISYTQMVDVLTVEYDYSTTEAIYAAINCGADWNAEALDAALGLLEGYYLSYDVLITLLEDAYFFTEDQATYAADNCGADWNAEALGVALCLLEDYFLSCTMLVGVLEDTYLFTSAQAAYAADNCGADWYEQAYIGALYYAEFLTAIGYTPTKDLLVEILVDDEYFTTAQATYGAEQALADLYGTGTEDSGSTDSTTAGSMIELTVDGVTYYVGQSASELPTPDETLASVYNLTWYVYGTTTYKDFFVAGVSGNKVVALMSAGVGFTYQGMCCGSALGSYSSGTYNGTSYRVTVATDSNDSYIVHAVLVMLSSYASYTNQTTTAYAGEAKLNFHLTNAFRVYHGRSVLTWSSAAATAAQLHSQDMADNNYFSHTGLNGSAFTDRLSAQGVSYKSAGENIAAGYATGFLAYNGWVNSSGHRSNMLGSSYTCLGTGLARNASSDYIYYFTQLFYS